jgi:hypothetical protein
MVTADEKIKEYVLRFSSLADEAFIACFNREVGINAWGFARQICFAAIRQELDRRRLDYSNIGDERRMSYGYAVYLRGNKLLRLSDLPGNEAAALFTGWMREYRPETAALKPVLVDYDNDVIRFSVSGHTGLLSMDSNDLVKNRPGQPFRP